MIQYLWTCHDHTTKDRLIAFVVRFDKVTDCFLPTKNSFTVRMRDMEKKTIRGNRSRKVTTKEFGAFWQQVFFHCTPSSPDAHRLAAALMLLLASAVLLQAQTNVGNIRGYVYDETRAVVPGVTVTAVDRSRGVERQTRTSDLGEYFFSHLDPGLYTLSFEAEDFAPYLIEDFEVRVGETASFSPQLMLAAAQNRIVVSAESVRLAIDPDKTQQSDHIDFVSIRSLPINRRDYLDLALLTPGVVDTNYVADDSDFRIAPTPQSGLGIGGTNGRGNTFMLDGLSNVYNSGGVRSSISQEVVHEFQINRNSFSSELGGAPGGAINIVTKGGTNELHGTLFGVLRNRRFQARNFFDPSKSAYTRAQSGMSLGGPIVRDKTFFYGAYERLDRHESVFVPLLQDKSFLYQITPSQQGPWRMRWAARRLLPRLVHWSISSRQLWFRATIPTWSLCSRRTAVCFRSRSSANNS